MNLRITSGKLRSRLLAGSVAPGVRPSSERNRQAIFNILGNDLKGQGFLDLCCGSGIMGFEAYSRGATWITWVDSERRVLQEVVRNCQALSIPDSQYQVVRGNIDRNLSFLGQAAFNCVFLDPPYALGFRKAGFYEKTINQLFERGQLLPEGVIIVECDAGYEFRPEACVLKQLKRKIYGRTAFSFWGQA